MNLNQGTEEAEKGFSSREKQPSPAAIIVENQNTNRPQNHENRARYKGEVD
jgi:hypothetical protein